MPERTYTAGSSYRFGFNGQEKDDELLGPANVNTAEFWEYDCRLGRRWNMDPISLDWQGLYTCFNNNPICLSDITGLTSHNLTDPTKPGSASNPIELDRVDKKAHRTLFDKLMGLAIKASILIQQSSIGETIQQGLIIGQKAIDKLGDLAIGTIDKIGSGLQWLFGSKSPVQPDKNNDHTIQPNGIPWYSLFHFPNQVEGQKSIHKENPEDISTFMGRTFSQNEAPKFEGIFGAFQEFKARCDIAMATADGIKDGIHQAHKLAHNLRIIGGIPVEDWYNGVGHLDGRDTIYRWTLPSDTNTGIKIINGSTIEVSVPK